jgi:hypothetical protein
MARRLHLFGFRLEILAELQPQRGCLLHSLLLHALVDEPLLIQLCRQLYDLALQLRLEFLLLGNPLTKNQRSDATSADCYHALGC